MVKKKHGGDYLREQQAKTEVARINRDLKRLKAQIADLQEQKSKLMNDPRGEDLRSRIPHSQQRRQLNLPRPLPP